MKVRWAPTSNCPAGQFIIHAENEQEYMILQQFHDYYYKKKKWKFWIHGWSFDSKVNTSGWSSFNFGLIRKTKGDSR